MRNTIARSVVVCLFFVFAMPSLSIAQEEESGAVSLMTLSASPGMTSFVTVEGASVPEGIGFGLKSMFNYQYKPLVMRECAAASGNECTDWTDDEAALIKHRVEGELLGAVHLFGIFEAGLALPFVMYQGGEDVSGSNIPSDFSNDISVAGLEDLRLHLKLDILQGLAKKDGGKLKFSLAFVPVITFPLGNAVAEDSFLGDSFLTFHPKVASTLKIHRFRVGVNAGFLFLEEQETYLTEVGSRVTYGAAAEYTINKDWSALVELFGQQAVKKEWASAPLEALGTARYKLPKGFLVSLGVGGGLIPGLGSPRLRVLASLGWVPDLKKSKEKERFFDEDLLQEQVDQDADGVADLYDQCPDANEDMDGFQDGDGCPDLDNDNDGIEDGYDSCANDAEDFDQYMDHDGCPELDNDNDGVPDTMDKCENELEKLNGKKDEDGCPDKGRALIVVEDKKLVPSRPIKFRKGSAKITGRDSFRALAVVVSVLQMNPTMGLRIEGHTDSSGPEHKNQELSFERAKSVMVYLIEQGIDPERLEGQGLGSDRPIGDNTTKRGRAKNNRVELHITKL